MSAPGGNRAFRAGRRAFRLVALVEQQHEFLPRQVYRRSNLPDLGGDAVRPEARVPGTVCQSGNFKGKRRMAPFTD